MLLQVTLLKLVMRSGTLQYEKQAVNLMGRDEPGKRLSVLFLCLFDFLLLLCKVIMQDLKLTALNFEINLGKVQISIIYHMCFSSV